eukprot:251927_1
MVSALHLSHGTNLAWMICEATNLIFLFAFMFVFIKGVCISNDTIKNKSDHRNLQFLRLALIFALICECIYPLQWIISLDNYLYSIIFHGLAALYDIIMPTCLTIIVMRMVYSYRVLFYPQFGRSNSNVKPHNSSNDAGSQKNMLSSSTPIWFLIPTFIWCFATYCLAIIQFLHFTWSDINIYGKIFNIYCMVWAVLEALFLIQLLYILASLQKLLRSEYRYKKCLEIGRVDNNGIANINIDRVDRYKMMMESMIRRMRRLIIGFSTYFLFIEGSYIWISMNHFHNYNSVLWITLHTTLGHIAIHITLLYYIRIRDYNEFDAKNDKFSFEVATESIESFNNNNNFLITTPLINDHLINASLSKKNSNALVNSLLDNPPIVGGLQGNNSSTTDDWEKYESSYKLPIDIENNT